MRLKNSLINSVVGLTMQVLVMVASFVSRAYFSKVLTVEYLGLESVFSDIINVLSITELGFATAIMFTLYKPIRENNYIKINSILKLYRSVYFFIGSFIFLFGLILLPFVNRFVQEYSSIAANVYFVFILYILNSTLSYFFSYKQALITAYQKDFIVQLIQKGYTIVSHIIEVIVLVYTKSYIDYLIVRIINTLLVNFTLSCIANKKFEFLDIKNAISLSQKEIKEIKANVKAMFLHKIGYKIVFSTDNLFISFFASLKYAGMYSNYVLITSSVALLIDMLLNGSVASIGDLKQDNDPQKSEIIFQKINFINNFLYSFASSVIFILLGDFIKLWLGSNYLLGTTPLSLIILNFYIHGMRRTVINFRDSWGLFYKDRYKPIFEVCINIFLQIVLGKIYGFVGILIGTSLTILFTSFWIEPYVLYKYGFHQGLLRYFIIYGINFLKMITVSILSWLILSDIIVNTIYEFIIKSLLSVFVIGFLTILFNYKNSSFKFYISMIRDVIRKEKI